MIVRALVQVDLKIREALRNMSQDAWRAMTSEAYPLQFSGA